MSDKPISDVPKVMDVNRPGEGKVMPNNSRPVIPHLSPNQVEDDIIKTDKTTSIHHKVIKPIGDMSEFENNSEEDTSKISHDREPDEDVKEGEGFNKENEPNSYQNSSDFDNQASDSAGVDALATAAAEKRLAKQKLDEDNKKEEELKEMTLSKQYHVPIKSTSGSKIIIIILSVVASLVVIAVIFATVLMLNAPLT